MHQTRAGRGVLELSYVAGRTAVTRARANSPLKLLLPRRPGPAAWVTMSHFGGGLVAGDRVDLEVRVGPGATGLLGTQSSNKVYRSPNGVPCRQSLRATLAEGAMFILAPDPVSCFAGAVYEQRQRFDLEAGSSLVVVDWVTSGRRARGERWAFRRYRSRIDIYLDEDHLLADALLLDPADGPLDGPYRLGRFHCLAVVILVGASLEDASRAIFEQVDAHDVRRGDMLIAAASPIPFGMVLRVMGETTELVGRYLTRKLRFLAEHLGEDVWSRKW